MDELLTIAHALDAAPFDLIQGPADDEPWRRVEITPLVLASRNELAYWVRGLSALVPQTPAEGLALCSSCRTPLNLGGSRKKLYYYCENQSCVSPVKRCPLGSVMREIRTFMEAIAPEIDAQLQSTRSGGEPGESVESLESQIIALRSEVNILERRRAITIQKLKNLAELPELDAKVVASAISSFDKKINAIQQEITETITRLERKRSYSDPLPPLAGVMEGWDLLPAPALREMLMTVVRAIVVAPDGSIVVVPVWEGMDE